MTEPRDCPTCGCDMQPVSIVAKCLVCGCEMHAAPAPASCSEVVERLGLCILAGKNCFSTGGTSFCAAQFDHERALAILHSWRERRVQELEEALRQADRVLFLLKDEVTALAESSLSSPPPESLDEPWRTAGVLYDLPPKRCPECDHDIFISAGPTKYECYICSLERELEWLRNRPAASPELLPTQLDKEKE